MKVAILGGSFNPPHLGHLFFANEVRQKLNYDKIIFVPSSVSPHKIMDNHTSSKNRFEMVKIATHDLPWAEVSDCDIIRGGITRSIDTVNDIIREYHLDSKPGFIIGDDLIPQFHMWKNPEKLCSIADLIVGVRDSNTVNIKFEHSLVNNRIFPLSSSEIRDRVNEGEYIDFLLPKEVIEYISCNGLYKKN